MPKVDPKTGEMMSDDPSQDDDELRGGKMEGDPGMKAGANPTGSDAPTQQGVRDPDSAT